MKLEKKPSLLKTTNRSIDVDEEVLQQTSFSSPLSRLWQLPPHHRRLETASDRAKYPTQDDAGADDDDDDICWRW